MGEEGEGQLRRQEMLAYRAKFPILAMNDILNMDEYKKKVLASAHLAGHSP